MAPSGQRSNPKNDSIRHIDGPGSIDCVPCWANPKRQTTNDAVIRITFPLGQIGQMCHCPLFRQNLQETGSQNDSTNIKILNQNLCIQSGIRSGLHSYDLWDFLFLPAFDWARFWCVFLRWMWDVDLVSLLVYSVSTRLNPWTGRQSFMQPPPPPPSQARDAAERLKTRQIALEVGLGADYMFDGTLCLSVGGIPLPRLNRVRWNDKFELVFMAGHKSGMWFLFVRQKCPRRDRWRSWYVGFILGVPGGALVGMCSWSRECGSGEVLRKLSAFNCWTVVWWDSNNDCIGILIKFFVVRRVLWESWKSPAKLDARSRKSSSSFWLF